MNTESFLRWRIWQTILSTDNVPFILNVSKVPNLSSWYITISPDTENEEIFLYNWKSWAVWTSWTITITGRWYNKYDAVAAVWNQKEHAVNDIYKWALNHIIINDKSSLSEDNTFDGNNIFSKSIKVPTYWTAALRDIAITTPSNWMICYITDVQDYYSFKNWIWVKWLWWNWGSVTWYQDSTDDWSLIWTINWVNTTFTLSNAPAQPQSVILIYNWQTLNYLSDYTISGKTITMILIPTEWKVSAIYPSAPVWTWMAYTRTTTITDAGNWELFRNSLDNNSLYFKDNWWDVIKILDITTNKIPTTLLELTKASDAEVLAWVENTKYITSKQVKDNYWIKLHWTKTEVLLNITNGNTWNQTSPSIFLDKYSIWITSLSTAVSISWDYAKLQYSSDNIAWTDLYSVVNTQTESKSYVSTFLAKWYYRVTINKAGAWIWSSVNASFTTNI